MARRTTSTTAREAAYRVVRNNTKPMAPTVSEGRVLRRLEAEGFDREQGRRALQALLADDAVAIRDGRVRPV